MLDDRPPLESELDAGGFEITTRPIEAPPPKKDSKAARPPASARGKAGRARGRGPGKGEAASGGKIRRVAAILALCLAPILLVTQRDRVVATLPGTASLYRSVGLPVNLVGLSFADLRSTLVRENDAPVLEVMGDIVNDGTRARTVPWLHIALEGADGEILYSWSTKAAEGELAVGRTAPFRVRLTAPPPAATKVEVTFLDERSRRTASGE